MPGVLKTINKESKIIEFETSPKEHELSGYRSISRFHAVDNLYGLPSNGSNPFWKKKA
jgi:hypothetical protein